MLAKFMERNSSWMSEVSPAVQIGVFNAIFIRKCHRWKIKELCLNAATTVNISRQPIKNTLRSFSEAKYVAYINVAK